MKRDRIRTKAECHRRNLLKTRGDISISPFCIINTWQLSEWFSEGFVKAVAKTFHLSTRPFYSRPLSHAERTAFFMCVVKQIIKSFNRSTETTLDYGFIKQIASLTKYFNVFPSVENFSLLGIQFRVQRLLRFPVNKQIVGQWHPLQKLMRRLEATDSPRSDLNFPGVGTITIDFPRLSSRSRPTACLFKSEMM